MNIFVAGTDTSVGKTVVSGILCLKLGWSYWKPIQSGSETDSDWIQANVGPLTIKEESYRLQTPLSPHASARIDRVHIDPAKVLKDFEGVDRTIIEGAGGLLVPLNKKFLLIDLIARMNVPLILVARSGLGTINHTLLSLAAIRERKIPLLGVVMVGELNPSNRQAIEYYGHVQVLGEIPPLSKIDRQSLSFASEAINLNEVRHEYCHHA